MSNMRRGAAIVLEFSGSLILNKVNVLDHGGQGHYTYVYIIMLVAVCCPLRKLSAEVVELCASITIDNC